MDFRLILFDSFPLLYIFSHVLPMLSYFQTRSIKQTTVFRGPLEIGSQLKINVYGYNRVFGILSLFITYKISNLWLVLIKICSVPFFS